LARTEWVIQWPGQVVLCTSQIFWAQEGSLPCRVTISPRSFGVYVVNQAIDDNSMDKFLVKTNDSLGDIVNLVRGELTQKARATLGNDTLLLIVSGSAFQTPFLPL
jgi:dynein heavy chain